MQYKVAFLSLALATLALGYKVPAPAPAPAPAPVPAPQPIHKCTTGSLQCCQQTQTASQAANNAYTKSLLGLIGVAVGDLTGVVGLDCSGVNVAGGGTCTAQAVCCTNNAKGGLISARLHSCYRLSPRD
ncbi:hypothetical protein BDP27DRAFT_1450935 [Rhodocollybia butyracea]|uniref:Hydrophobin n=1 Tax=Rhodocollybia butyracea TaxID=206335 RepID=A0A9P5PIP3_9AGAR|nr:hypothetical protein BDP27DRAFT_1450935 [Rhodocollybia butyracea]